MSILKIVEIKLNISPAITGKYMNIISLNKMLHDYLMSFVELDYVEYLHEQIIKPYSQHLIWDSTDNIYLWKIATLNDEATEKIIYPIMNNLQLDSTVELKSAKDNITLTMLSKNYIHSATYNQLIAKYFINDSRIKKIEFLFTSPVIMHSYQEKLLPQAKDIIANLLAIWNLFANEQRLYEDNLVENLSNQMILSDYDLRFKPLKENQQQIPTFTGKYIFDLENNIMAKKLIAILCEYANYIGLGMNTHLGFGAVETKIYRK